MANKDKTGPEGRGPRTGRGLGNCPSNDNARFATPRPRQGMGRRNERRLENFQ